MEKLISAADVSKVYGAPIRQGKTLLIPAAELLTIAGFAELFPMPRGGAGYSEAGQRAIVNAWGEAD